MKSNIGSLGSMKARSIAAELAVVSCFMICAVSCPCISGHADANWQAVTNADGTVTVLVTPRIHSKKEASAAASLTADDFAVKENGRPQKVVSAKPAAEAPLAIEVLIQDNLRSRIDDELKALKTFIKDLPAGTNVLTGYLTTGSLDVRHDFTTDLDAAAASLRVLTGHAPYNPYVGIIDGLKRFDTQTGRRIIVLVSDGLDLSRGREEANPSVSIDLEHAIQEASKRRVSVFSFFEPTSEPGESERLDVTFGQGSLQRISDETGGDAFVGPTDVVSLSPYIAEMKDEMARQWLVTYQSTTSGKGFRKLQVVSERNVHLLYPRGYWAK